MSNILSAVSSPAQLPIASENFLSSTISQPTTIIHIRLADGTRLKAQFSLAATVSELYNYVASASPDNLSFILQTTFPSKDLIDRTLSLKDANILNAVLIQKLT